MFLSDFLLVVVVVGRAGGYIFGPSHKLSGGGGGVGGGGGGYIFGPSYKLRGGEFWI